MTFFVAQVISCGDCCEWLPWWLCAAFRTHGPQLGLMLSISGSVFVGAAFNWQRRIR